MKWIAIGVPDTVHTESFTLESEATLSNGMDTVSGKVCARGQQRNPPTFEDAYKNVFPPRWESA